MCIHCWHLQHFDVLKGQLVKISNFGGNNGGYIEMQETPDLSHINSNIPFIRCAGHDENPILEQSLADDMSCNLLSAHA